jgi:FKBP-type peptidyl-prolyl cis-trans isomerase
MSKEQWGVVLTFLALAGCGGGDAGTVAYPEARHQPSATAPAVDLSAMAQTASGLRILEVEVGEGAEARSGQTVTVYYTGWFLDGDRFDSSVDRGQTFSFTLGRGEVIAGWDEGVAGMRVGGWRRLVIPPELAYGEAGRPGIPPNSTLVFDVELVDAGGQ